MWKIIVSLFDKKEVSYLCMTKSSSLLNVLRDAVGGAVAGLIAGLILGLAIKFISIILLPFDGEGPDMLAPFMGMGFGTLVGAILGGLAGLKNE